MSHPKITIHSFIYFLGFLLVSVAYTQQSDWKIAINKNDIKVYKRSMEGSVVKEVKSVAYVEAPLELIIELYEDDSLYEDWCHKCKTIQLVEQINPNEKVIYYQTNSPWPVKDRYSYSLHKKSVNEKTQAISYTITDYSKYYPELQENKVRMTDQKGLWRFTPLANGQVELYYQQYVDAGGSLPKWLVNRFITKVPYHSLRKFHQLIIDSLEE